MDQSCNATVTTPGYKNHCNQDNVFMNNQLETKKRNNYIVSFYSICQPKFPIDTLYLFNSGSKNG